MDFTTANSRSNIFGLAASLRRYVGKLNHPKTSDNLSNGTNKNSDLLVLGIVET